MNRQLTALALTLCMLVGCSEKHPDAKEPHADTTTQDILQAHERITEETILSDFLSNISENRYDEAIALLHPKL